MFSHYSYYCQFPNQQSHIPAAKTIILTVKNRLAKHLLAGRMCPGGRRKIMKKIVLLLVAAFTAAFASAAQDADSLYAKDLLQPGTAAPDFTLPSPDGTKHSLSELKGSIVVLDFWASWCPDCRKDIPAMKELHDKYGKSVKFLSVSFDDKKDNWVNCINKYGMDWLHVSELKKWKTTQVSKLYNIKWIPSVYILDRNGDIILSTVMIEKVAAKLKELHEL